MFKNIISLGFFCGVAEEMERLGLRTRSMPFDWVISPSFSSVLSLIESGFSGFVGVPHWFEDCSNRADNDTYQIQFFHDFKRPAAIDAQLKQVSVKYDRRAAYFSAAVTNPTLFIRYIADADEYEWICSNRERIDTVIRSGNPDNEIIFIGHHAADGALGYRYFQVEPDNGDVVARHFAMTNNDLSAFLTGGDLFDPVQRKKNRRFYYWKRLRKFLKKFPDKARSLLNRIHA